MGLKFLHEIFYNSQSKKYNRNSMHSYNRNIWLTFFLRLYFHDGTYQKLAKNPTCEIIINGTPVFSATLYEYLGVMLDSSLSLQLQLTKIYKKISARLRLLHRICSNASPAVAESIYFSLILPTLLYCYPIYCNISTTSNAKLQSLHNRAEKMVNSSNGLKWESLITVRKWQVCVDVFKSLRNIGPEIQLNKFEKFDHGKYTWGNNCNCTLVKCSLGQSAR